MAKISISLPDQLKEQLDQYATDTGFKRSEAVAHILTAYFTGHLSSPESIPPQRIQAIEHQLEQALEYLNALHQQNPKKYPRPAWLPNNPRPPRSFISRRRPTKKASKGKGKPNHTKS